ncbi:MAG: Gfo/Idh/MocA family oxidoreductase [Pseudomonadota bacterium]
MTYRVAIVGAGIGAEHLSAYLQLSSFEVACICDLDLARAQSLAEPHGIKTVTDMDEVIRDHDIDIVDICLPPHLHVSASLAALDAGKHVICEKPLATSLADAETLAVRSRQTGMNVFPVFQYRFGVGSAQLAALIESGVAGRCYAGSLETHWSRGSDYYEVDWRGTWAGEQGGALLGHAIHIHDMVTGFLGPVTRVYAETATRVNEIETEDCAALTIRMESGALITSSVTLGAAHDQSRVRLAFEGFTVESDHAPYAPAAAPWHFLARAPKRQSDIEAVLATVDAPPTGFEGLFTEIANSLDGRPNNAVLLEDGLRSVEFVTAAYHSSRSGEAVQLPLGAHHPLSGGWRPKDVP